MRSLRQGAQRASIRIRLAATPAAATIAFLAVVIAGIASPAPVAAASPPFPTAEALELKLVNCTRTGGWVLASGACSGYGTGRYSRYVAPLKLSAGLSNVARGRAKWLAVRNRCSHGDVGARLRNAGYTSGWYGENIGCGSGYRAVAAVIAFHRMMQAEKSTNGPHWKNIKNSTYRYIGIGVWKYNGRTRLVTDFYRP